jgi:hypothetical protein
MTTALTALLAVTAAVLITTRKHATRCYAALTFLRGHQR